MLYCNDCKATFHEDDLTTHTETLCYIDSQPYTEDYGTCPECGETDYTEAVKCALCEEYTDETKSGLCLECETHTRKTLADFIAYTFSEAQLDYIYEEIGVI